MTEMSRDKAAQSGRIVGKAVYQKGAKRIEGGVHCWSSISGSFLALRFRVILGSLRVSVLH